MLSPLPFLILLSAAFLLSSFAEESPKAKTKKYDLWVPEIMFGSDPLPPLPDGAFTIAVIPDTQSYIGKTGRNIDPAADKNGPTDNPYLAAQIDWILKHKENENIVFVTHVGDIVDRNDPLQWAVAKKYIDRLRGVVPFGLTPGNHDIGSTGGATNFQASFPASSFQSYPWYLESYTHDREDQNVSANNVNSAQIFSAGGIDFLHINLECNAPDDVVEWAGKLLEAHPNRTGIITTHMDLGLIAKPAKGQPKDLGRMKWTKRHGKRGNSPEQLWDKLYRLHPNLDYIISGDQSGVTAHRLERKADDGHTIVAMMSDYRWQPVVRLMRFRPDKGELNVLTYHIVGDFLVNKSDKVEDPAQHEFTIPLHVKHTAAEAAK